MIRFDILLLATFMAASAAHAEPMWQKYNLDEGIALDLPGKPTIESGVYRDYIAKTVKTKIYKTEVDNVRYQVIVADFRNRLIDTPNILGEAYLGQSAKGTLVQDIPVRTDVVGKAAYGRQVTVDTKDGVRSAASIYSYGGYLFIFETDILPAGDRGSPEPSRFHYSIQFDPSHDWSAPPPQPKPANAANVQAPPAQNPGRGN